MPIIANAKKALRQTKTHTTRNRVIRAQVKTAIKKTTTKPSEKELSSLFSTLDRAVKRHIIHKNKAARLKTQAAKRLMVTPQPSAKQTVVKSKAAKKKRPVKKITTR